MEFVNAMLFLAENGLFSHLAIGSDVLLGVSTLLTPPIAAFTEPINPYSLGKPSFFLHFLLFYVALTSVMNGVSQK